jgi:hypothetical protein
MSNPEKRCVMNRGDIHVQWRGLYGNNLFQLAGGLVLAIESGAHLRSKPISGMPLTKLSLPDPPKLCHETRLDQPHFNREFLVDLLNRGQHVVVNGHHQQYRHYREHKEAIRRLFMFHGEPSYEPSPSDLVVHLRLQGQFQQWPYDLDLVRDHVRSWRDGNVVIVTDEPLHPYLVSNFRKPGYRIVSQSLEKDFCTLLRAHRLVITPSTFGWWGAFLGNAHEVFFPHQQGIWRKPYIDLWVDDEERFIKY